MSDEEKNILKDNLRDVLLELHPMEERQKASSWTKWGLIVLTAISLFTGTVTCLGYIDGYFQLPATVSKNSKDIEIMQHDLAGHTTQLAVIQATSTDSNDLLRRIAERVLYPK